MSVSLYAALIAGILLYGVANIVYRLSSAHPLAKIPGPLIARLTDLQLVWHAYIGDEGDYVRRLHDKYGPVVRIGTESVDFTTPEVINPIYIQKGGFAKAKYYNNFDIDGHASIFSETSPAKRAARAKAVLPLFSAANVRAGCRPFTDSVERYVYNFGLARKSGKANALDLARCMSIDAVTEYLFGIRYGALKSAEELETKNDTNKVEGAGQGEKMSASAIVDNFVSTARLWYLAPWLYDLADRLDALIFPNPAFSLSFKIVNEFVDRVLVKAKEDISKNMSSKSYPARLLQAGFSPEEVHAQCKDIIFAGTDTIGMNLTTLCFMLAKNHDVYEKLEAEVAVSHVEKDEDLQTQMPYLTGVVREALRLSLTNPTRLPREVPAGGWEYGGVRYPAGSIVSTSQLNMHFQERIYGENPHAFRPERWFNATEEMHRCMMAFGLGGRQCVARTMSMYDMHLAAYALVKAGYLKGARPVCDSIEIYEGHTAKVKSGKVELIWD
ncbi:cytochrome P450 oxidoreductase [Xylariaceae sp. FL1272]|nr:cytochrome P450 oxidoreductase [Xylariaceae sp. FL1272]